MNPEDNCATSLIEIPKNDNIIISNKKSIRINHNIPMGHKFALNDIKKGDFVKKYGEKIGIAIEDIKKGDWIHIHNIKSYYLGKIANE